MCYSFNIVVGGEGTHKQSTLFVVIDDKKIKTKILT